MKAQSQVLLAATLVAAVAVADGAQAGGSKSYHGAGVTADARVSANVRPPRVEFRTQPRWQMVSGTNVYMVRAEDRPGFDMFRYNDSFYIYDNGHWFKASRWNGNYQRIDRGHVPMAIARVPEAEWRSYPHDWSWSRSSHDDGNRYSNEGYSNEWSREHDSYDSSEGWSSWTPDPASDFRAAPRWRFVPGTRVYVLSDASLAAYDMFRLGSTVYLHTGEDTWFRADRWNGRYERIDATRVPRDIARVPEREWRHYPRAWATDYSSWRSTHMDQRYGRMNDRDADDRFRYDNRYRHDNRYRVEDRHTARSDRYGWRNAPPAPPTHLAFRSGPRWKMVPGTMVYVAGDSRADFDMFRAGGRIYVHKDGYWYRSNRWNGGFMAIDHRQVPDEFRRIPSSHWHAGSPFADGRYSSDYASGRRYEDDWNDRDDD